jgi:hypothetical protein
MSLLLYRLFASTHDLEALNFGNRIVSTKTKVTRSRTSPRGKSEHNIKSISFTNDDEYQ